MESSHRTTPVRGTEDALWQHYRETLAACSKQVDAFHLTLHAARNLGASRAAICIADPALGGKLVVRLSVDMEGASNKVVGASTPGRTAALEAFARGQVLVVEDYAASDYSPTDLEEHQRIAGAVHLPISAPHKGTLGLLIAAQPADAPFPPATVALLGRLTDELGRNLERLGVTRPFALERTATVTGTWPEGLFEAFNLCLNTSNIEALSDRTLEQCRRFTGSEFGFVGYVETDTGFLVCPTMTRDIFAQCRVAGKTVVFEKAGGLGGWVLDNKAPLIANDPRAHPASVGTPPGHLPIRKFMGVPCFSQGVLVGMIALANKDSDYTGDDLRIVSAFADIYAAAVARFFSERELTASRNRLAALYQEAPCGYHTLSPDGTILEINDTELRMLGRTREEVDAGLNIAELLTTTGRGLLADQIRALKARKNPAPVELHLRLRDGRRVPVLHSASASFDERGFLRYIRCTVVDITERRAYELALRKSNRALTTLSRGNETLVRATSEAELLRKICDVLVDVGGYRLAWIAYAENDARKTVRPVARAGRDADYVDHIQVTWDESPTGNGPGGMAIRTGRPQVFQDIAQDPRFHPWRSEAMQRGYAANAALPLQHEGKVLGVLALYAEQPHAFDADEMQLLNELSNDIAFGIVSLRTRAEHSSLQQEREHHLQRLKESMEDTVQAIAATIEKRDPYTAGHQQRVARLAVAMARHMSLSQAQIEGIHFGGLIHDIGKIAVPAEILSKPGVLSPMEFELIKEHPTAGCEILKGVKFPWPILRMVHEHHERMDGSGYPQGLKGDDIQLEARIIAVADVVEAMSSFRPYRPALGIEAAMEEIAARRATVYDGDAVDACLAVLRQGFNFDN